MAGGGGGERQSGSIAGAPGCLLKEGTDRFQRPRGASTEQSITQHLGETKRVSF